MNNCDVTILSFWACVPEFFISFSAILRFHSSTYHMLSQMGFFSSFQRLRGFKIGWGEICIWVSIFKDHHETDIALFHMLDTCASDEAVLIVVNSGESMYLPA